MIVELISVGTEILMGNITNTNAQYLARECTKLGLSVYYQVSVGDNEGRLLSTVQTAVNRSDIVIITGGLGPTEDDLTKETVAKALHLDLLMDEEVRCSIETYFNRAGRKEITNNNWKQAFIIEGAKVLPNSNGTAPGLYLNTKEDKHFFLLPGPPNELIPMFQQIISILKKFSVGTLYSSMVKVCGISESKAEEMIKDIIDTQTNPTIAPYAKTGEVNFRITAMAEDEEEGEKLITPMVTELKKRFGDNIYTMNEEETLEEHVILRLREKGYTLTAAESCTGGLFLGTLVNVSGASEVIKEGYITYSEEAKRRLLGVKEDTLSQFSVVSEEVAKEMAIGAAVRANAEVSIGITGIAGPLGGSDKKPVGTVCIACYTLGKVIVKTFIFNGNREKVRALSVHYALDLVRRCLSNI